MNSIGERGSYSRKKPMESYSALSIDFMLFGIPDGLSCSPTGTVGPFLE